jgi:predicted phage terminase large subunit-like protein
LDCSAEWVSSLPEADRLELARLLTPKLTKYIPPNPLTGGARPSVPQAAFLLLPHLEALYGGAAGGGKSEALLMGALQYVDCPGYAAILFRRTFADLMLPGALIPRSHEWLSGSDAHWNGKDYRWTFPSGATLSFGYLQAEDDKYRYQGAEFQFVGFDELTHFTETQYRYLFSRLRRLKGARVPIRARSSANPGGRGHDWVKARFIVSTSPDRVFVPAKLDDNPHLDKVEYEASLAQLDPITRARLREGNWDVREAGGYFRREWFEVVDQAPRGLRWVRRWDLAATELSPQSPDPDWTVGLKMGERDGVFYIADVRRERRGPAGVEDLVRHTAQTDGIGVEISLEQEPGSSGKTVAQRYARVLKGFTFKAKPSTGDKVERAKPFSAAAFNLNVKVVRGPWNAAFFDELEAFPEGGHDDQVDAGSGAIEHLSQGSTFVVEVADAPPRPSGTTM